MVANLLNMDGFTKILTEQKNSGLGMYSCVETIKVFL